MKFKKLLSTLLAVAILSVSCVTMASAATNENVGVSEVPPITYESEIVPFGVSKPSKNWNLSSQGRYNFSGNSYGQDLYSNYNLTGVNKVKIYVKNNYSGTLKIKLLKSQTGIDWAVSKMEIDGGEEVTWTASGLDSSAKYILKFYGPSDFSGWIEKA
ncbi:MAG TPA: hypothetical protein IAB39_02495 [Candidatus Onthovicinus excrementipullorum]|nr:hypothetical protein [Candidatus Onthovicinus excrementipullorum]